MRILYLYPYYGELGWEIWNWKTHCAWVRQQEGPFDHVFASVRAGHEGVYPFVKEFNTFTEYEDKTEGNAFVLHAPEAYNHYKAHCMQCDASVKTLQRQGHFVRVVRLPPTYYRYHRFKERHRLFEHIPATNELLAKWSERVESTALIFHLRHITRSTKKNTPEALYKAADKWAKKNGRQFITVGKVTGNEPKFKIRGWNLLDKTTLADLIAILHVGGMVTGSSSGPMHLAAATETPHVVWGGGHKGIRERYLKNWNKLKTPVEHLTLKFSVADSKLQHALSRIASLPESNSEVRDKQNAHKVV